MPTSHMHFPRFQAVVLITWISTTGIAYAQTNLIPPSPSPTPVPPAGLTAKPTTTGAVPPPSPHPTPAPANPTEWKQAKPTPAQEQARTRESGNTLAKDTALAVPTSVIKAVPVLDDIAGTAGSAADIAKTGKAVGQAAGIIDYTVKAGELANAYSKEGWAGVKDKSIQMGLDTGISGGIEAGIITRWAVPRAVGAGLSGAMATGGAGLAFTAGTIAGGYIREELTINGKRLGDHVDDGYFYIAPDFLKEAVSGVPQDWDSPAAQAAMAEKIRKNREEFKKTEQKNAEQKYWESRRSTPVDMPAPILRDRGPSSDFNNPSSTLDMMSSFNQMLQQYGQAAQAARTQRLQQRASQGGGYSLPICQGNQATGVSCNSSSSYGIPSQDQAKSRSSSSGSSSDPRMNADRPGQAYKEGLRVRP